MFFFLSLRSVSDDPNWNVKQNACFSERLLVKDYTPIIECTKHFI